jgi:hypothetical protein
VLRVFRFTLGAVLALVALLVGERTGIAQQPPFRAALQIRLVWMDVDYGDQKIQGQGVLLRGEPLVFDVGVVNNYEGPLAGAEKDWPQRISASLRAGGRFDKASAPALPLQCTQQAVRASNVKVIDDYLQLGPQGSQFIRCRADAAAYGLTGGRYTVSVEWSNQADAQRFRERERHVHAGPSPLSSEVEFEFREVITEDDELDLLNHLASHAYLENSFDRALQLVQRVLNRRPSSTTALALRGRINKAQGACDQGRADLERAASIIEGDLDTGSRSIARMSPDDKRLAVRNLREQARGLQCR